MVVEAKVLCIFGKIIKSMILLHPSIKRLLLPPHPTRSFITSYSLDANQRRRKECSINTRDAHSLPIIYLITDPSIC